MACKFDNGCDVFHSILWDRAQRNKCEENTWGGLLAVDFHCHSKTCAWLYDISWTHPFTPVDCSRERQDVRRPKDMVWTMRKVQTNSNYCNLVANPFSGKIHHVMSIIKRTSFCTVYLQKYSSAAMRVAQRSMSLGPKIGLCFATERWDWCAQKHLLQRGAFREVLQIVEYFGCSSGQARAVQRYCRRV